MFMSMDFFDTETLYSFQEPSAQSVHETVISASGLSVSSCTHSDADVCISLAEHSSEIPFFFVPASSELSDFFCSADCVFKEHFFCSFASFRPSSFCISLDASYCRNAAVPRAPFRTEKICRGSDVSRRFFSAAAPGRVMRL